MTDCNLSSFLATHPAVLLVEVTVAKGSTPRDAGTMMLVAAEDMWGTIGGGQLEFMAIDHARALLSGKPLPLILDVPLGPEIGQCCGGRTQLRFAPVDSVLAETLRQRLRREQDAYRQVMVFGAGHVGRALAQALGPLPLQATMIETRDLPVPSLHPAIPLRHVAMPEAEVTHLSPGSAVVIMTHDHGLDFLIARQALARGDLAYVGMIGSATKRATFAHWLQRDGGDPSLIDRLVLPIGGSAVRDKRPAVIAALVAAELLTALMS
ncbi:xanthine dehydrogenase accessory protein XdhC [Agrobacterium sp. a22-2]|uniref:xanthine dehydrogenase accessory protein XdhC n=1 Tax=Agrobacterium sp. a22-2 TaxID=2283840 RepID=UPI00144552A3|nr:xanthine dehydrogenase accessory protein XdhC [Agrobacterium sp. a22-2]NKN35794.1 xanthine dehydrogenase accessory protein XdhC [Agrobacterium sp. a22-2]